MASMFQTETNSTWENSWPGKRSKRLKISPIEQSGVICDWICFDNILQSYLFVWELYCPLFVVCVNNFRLFWYWYWCVHRWILIQSLCTSNTLVLQGLCFLCFFIHNVPLGAKGWFYTLQKIQIVFFLRANLLHWTYNKNTNWVREMELKTVVIIARSNP